MKITSLDQTAAIPMTMEGAAGVTKQLPLGHADGAPGFSFRVFTLEPGGHTPYHVHDAEHLNFVLEGEGALVDETGALHPLKGGDFALVEPHEKHQYRNTSKDRSFKMICAVPTAFE